MENTDSIAMPANYHVAVDEVVKQLQRLGMSGYEAKAYIALVAAGVPLNGYEVAKRSGVPRSTVYETLAKLVARSAAFEVRSGEPSTIEYIPLQPATLFGRIRDDTEDAIETLAPLLGKLVVRPTVRYTHTLPTRADVLSRCQDLIAAADSTLLIWAWPEELNEVEPTLRRADSNGVDVTVMTFDEAPNPPGKVHRHVLATAEEVRRVLGCNLLVAVADEQGVVVAGLAGEEAWGIYTDDPAIVMLAAEFIILDIVNQDFIRYVGPEKLAEFKRDHSAYLRRRPNVVTLLRRLTADEGPPRRGSARSSRSHTG